MIANDEKRFFKEETNFIALSLDPPTVIINLGEECDGVYILRDGYCRNRQCDCEFGVLTATRQKNEEIVINVGWKAPSYYIKRGFSYKDVKLLRYGCLDTQVKNQPAYAQEFLNYFRRLMEEEDQQLTDYMRYRYHHTKIYGSY